MAKSGVGRPLREDYIHYVVREYLKSKKWVLIAGQYPDGSDDELLPLNVMDPKVSRDRSPDPRRHSRDKLVPDLVAIKTTTVLVLEMKPTYSPADEQKLRRLLGERREDFVRALDARLSKLNISIPKPSGELTLAPGLGVSALSEHVVCDDFCYLLIDSLGACAFKRSCFVDAL